MRKVCLIGKGNLTEKQEEILENLSATRTKFAGLPLSLSHGCW